MSDEPHTSDDERRDDRGPGDERDEPRGREASAPRDISTRGWRDILLRVKEEMQADSVAMMAAGMAFYAMLAVFPALIALITLYGLMASPADVERSLGGFVDQLPAGSAELVREQLHGIVQSSSSTLGLGFLLSVVAALWTASSGAVGMIKAVNVAYDEPEERGFLKLRGLGIAFTLGALAVCAVTVGLLGLLPNLFDSLGLGSTARSIAAVVQYVMLAGLIVVGLGVVYRYAPCRDQPKARWVSVGAVVAMLLWLAATAGFDFYASRFGSYQETYGALGAVVVLLMWLFLSSFAILLGAELNSEMEAQTAKDTAVGERKPRGERRARKADRLGEAMG